MVEEETSIFEKAVKVVQENGKKVDKMDKKIKLEVYSLFKQGSIGDCNTKKPGALDLKGKAKWGAWNQKKGMEQDKAKEEYVTLAKSIFPDDAHKIA